MNKYIQKISSYLVLLVGLMAAVHLTVGHERVRAEEALAGESWIIDSWLEEPHLLVSYIWNLYERRGGWYLEEGNWSDNKIDAVDTFVFGAREAFKLMQMSDLIAAHHEGDTWVQLYNVATNMPEGRDTDRPPHLNIISYWGRAGRSWAGAVNGHFYTTEDGKVDTRLTWYAWDIAPNCERGVRNPEVNMWMGHVDRNCNLIWEERVTPEGEIQLRRSAGAPIYTVRGRSPTRAHILRDGQHVRTVERVFHNAWIDYPEPHPVGQARVVWEIWDYEARIITTETIIANAETGEILSHERVDREMEEEQEPEEREEPEEPEEPGEPETRTYFFPQVHR